MEARLFPGLEAFRNELTVAENRFFLEENVSTHESGEDVLSSNVIKLFYFVTDNGRGSAVNRALDGSTYPG